MSRDSTCEEPLTNHLCWGPLYNILDNGKKRIVCLGIVKYLIKRGHNIFIKENVPRKFKEIKTDKFESTLF